MPLGPAGDGVACAFISRGRLCWLKSQHGSEKMRLGLTLRRELLGVFCLVRRRLIWGETRGTMVRLHGGRRGRAIRAEGAMMKAGSQGRRWALTVRRYQPG